MRVLIRPQFILAHSSSREENRSESRMSSNREENRSESRVNFEELIDLIKHFQQYRNDLNDDYCSVCKDGGELVCCSTCPRVFHYECHIPPIPESLGREEEWQCRLCANILEEPIPEEYLQRNAPGLKGRDLMICERILLEVMCHPNSQPFHHIVCERVPHDNIVEIPIDLAVMKKKLTLSHCEHYETVEKFIDDMIRMLVTCYADNQEQRHTGMFVRGKQIERFFKILLTELSPGHVNYFSDEKLTPIS